MQGDGLVFPVNQDAGGESAGTEWAHLVAPRPLGDGDGDMDRLSSVSSTLAHGLGFAEERHRRRDDGGMV
jgi:hypothetical protein